MTGNSRRRSGGNGRKFARSESGDDLPLDASVGYQIRATHRALQRHLQMRIVPHGVSLGMWYFLRALWAEDGLTQRELSRRIGTMEPTTLTAIAAMERKGFVSRVRSEIDRRKIHVRLTVKGRQLKATLMPLAIEVVNTATAGFSDDKKKLLLGCLSELQRNLEQDSLTSNDETTSDLAL
jgi:DNA-binding MarR family transcriptional regulator